MRSITRTAAALAVVGLASIGLATSANADPLDFQKGQKNAPGQADRIDADGNGYSDAGVYVTGHYTALYAEDGNGDYYQDLGDGRVVGTVSSVDELDAASLVTCDYQNTYRADYGNDPYMNEGWITNQINCSDGTHYSYLIVSQSDPRYTGNPDFAVWGTWEYHVLASSGEGNIVNRPVLVG